MASSVYVVLLNWNGWKDTIECLESVLRMSYGNFRVVVCDNGSQDRSIQHILDWAAGKLEVTAVNSSLASLSQPPIPKPCPVAHVRLSAGEFEIVTGNGSEPLVLIENGANLGFAAGCNVGLRWSMQQQGFTFAWLLNNDTVVKPDALTELVDYAEQHPQCGMIGSTILQYYEPGRVQAYGGCRYTPWMARNPGQTSENARNAKFDCILGCSMLVTKPFLEKVGLMSEVYFLYFEELDWAARARGLFDMGYCPASYIYHKEGASIGSSHQREKRSLLSERYLSRNRVVFTKRFYPWLLPSVLFWVMAAALFRLMKGDIVRAHTIFKAALEGLRN